MSDDVSSQVKKILAEKKISNIDILGIAKGKNRNAGDEKILKIDKEFKLNKNDEVLFFFQRLRDEAHRFAVQSTKAKHHKSFKNSLFSYRYFLKNFHLSWETW